MAIAPTVASLAKSMLQMFNPRSYRQEQPKRTILDGFRGVIHPGEMVLVVGQPGSGCTTFLKSLAGFQGEFHDTQGILQYGDDCYGENRDSKALTAFCGNSTYLLLAYAVADMSGS